MKMENRKRNVQVKFRLTPEENEVLCKCVNGSGMSRNDYIIRELINKATLPMLSWEKRFCGNSVEIICKLGKHTAGYVSCSWYSDQIQIHSLFVSKAYRKSELMDKLLEEVYVLAEENKSTCVKICCGAEPMAKDGQIPLEQEIYFYEKNGFECKNNILGGIPVMVKAL